MFKRHIYLYGLVLFMFFAVDSLPAAETNALTPSKRYLMAYDSMTTADWLAKRDMNEEAAMLYNDAIKIFQQLSSTYPLWQTNLVAFRMNYCQGELAKLSGTKQSPPSLVNVQSPALKPAVSGGAVQEERGSEPEAVRELKERNKKTAEAGKTADNQKAPAIEKNERYANLMLALTYCRDKQYKKAVKLAESVLKEDSSNAWAHVVMGVACAGRGEIDEAIAEMQKALALNPKLGEAHYNLAGLTLKKDPRNKSPAAEHYQNALQFGAAPDPELEKRLQK